MRSHAYTTILEPWRSHETYTMIRIWTQKTFSIIFPKNLWSSSPQNSKQANHSMPIFKAFFLGGVDTTKNNSRQLDELQRITAGQSRNTWRFGSIKSISRYPCEGQQVEGWAKKLLAGWNCWVTFPSFCVLVLRDVWRYLRKRGDVRNRSCTDLCIYEVGRSKAKATIYAVIWCNMGWSPQQEWPSGLWDFDLRIWERNLHSLSQNRNVENWVWDMLNHVFPKCCKHTKSDNEDYHEAFPPGSEFHWIASYVCTMSKFSMQYIVYVEI